MTEKFDQLEANNRELLDLIGEDSQREGLVKTPNRVARAWEYFSQGYRANLDDIINDAIFHEDCSEMVVVRDIEFFSMCEHHMIPFFGRAHVGYLPNKKLLDYLRFLGLWICLRGDYNFKNGLPHKLRIH